MAKVTLGQGMHIFLVLSQGDLQKISRYSYLKVYIDYTGYKV